MQHFAGMKGKPGPDHAHVDALSIEDKLNTPSSTEKNP